MELHKVRVDQQTYSPVSSIQVHMNDFMDPFNILQLADDSSILADNLDSLRIKTMKMFDYSTDKFQNVNIDKTKYMEFNENATLEDLTIDEMRNRMIQNSKN